MASGDRIYVDPSALRASYVHDDRSKRFCAWRKRVRGPLPVTRFGRTEIVNSVMLAVHRGLLDREEADAALGDFEDDLHAGRLVLLDSLWRRTLDLASELSREHTAAIGTRTLDVLHVATAVTLEMRSMVTYDPRQTRLAEAVELRVLSP